MEKAMKNKIKRSFIGYVVSDAMKKTLVVKVDRMKQHPKYKKAYRISRKFYVHDEKQIAKVGDKIKFVECRPLSKTKKWRLVEIINK